MSTPTIAFIGGGNMAAALIGGLIADGHPAQQLIVSDPSTERLQALSACGVLTTNDNLDALAQADVVVLAVKPQVLKPVAQALSPALQEHQPLVISIAAGVTCDTLNLWLGGNCALVRCMPNTPAMLQTGATGLYATEQVTETQRAQAESILRAVGLTQWVEKESLIDAVTALSGSGPAYYFLFMEAMQAAGEQLGLDAESARLLTLQTALGAARMAIESPEDPATLRARVTSPGGTTEQAIKRFEAGQLRELVQAAMQAACDRSVELSKQLGD